MRAKQDGREMTFWVHDLPARSYEQVAEYLTGDAHDRSKVQVFDGKRFYNVTVGGDLHGA